MNLKPSPKPLGNTVNRARARVSDPWIAATALSSLHSTARPRICEPARRGAGTDATFHVLTTVNFNRASSPWVSHVQTVDFDRFFPIPRGQPCVADKRGTE